MKTRSFLDGGGSYHAGFYVPDFGTSSTINSPSEGTPRSVSNAIFLLSNLSPTGTAGSLYVTPKSLTLLPGATTQCVASGHGHRLVSHGHPPRRCNLVLGG